MSSPEMSKPVMLSNGREVFFMLTFLAIVSGALSAITVVQNGNLALYLGNYRATVVVHAVGLVTVLLVLAVRRQRITWQKMPQPAHCQHASAQRRLAG